MSDPGSAVAFIGLGVMGYPMAVNLRSKLDKETSIFICDVNDAVIDRFKKEMSSFGPVEVVKNGYEAVQKADVVIAVLPSNDIVRSVYLDPQTGVFAGAKASDRTDRNKLVIECGTISQAVILEVSQASKSVTGLQFVDAPISGGPMGSKNGTLSFMVGCPGDYFDRIRALLVHMGKPESIRHCGDVGAGTACKTINNYISLISVVSVSEAYSIASRMGIDLNILTDVFNSSSAQCWVTSTNNPVPGIDPNSAASRGYTGGFRVELARKDLGLAEELASLAGARVLLGKSALRVYEEVAEDGRYTGLDARVVYKYLVENDL